MPLIVQKSPMVCSSLAAGGTKLRVTVSFKSHYRGIVCLGAGPYNMTTVEEGR